MDGRRHRRAFRTFAMLLAVGLFAAACGGADEGDEEQEPTAASGEEATDTEGGEEGPDDPGEEAGAEEASYDAHLVIQTFGSFGYSDELFARFEDEYPGITVTHEHMGQLDDYSPLLVQYLSAGSGAGDVVALEEGVLHGYLEDHQDFVNLFDLGADELADHFLDWKWEGGITPDGEKLVGLGTDVGGLAMCYQRDLFEAAGLPTDRDEVSELIATWDDYLEAGRRFAENSDAAWLDSATSIVQPYVYQNSDVFFYDTDGNFIGEENPVFREAWDFGLQLSEEGLTAGLQRWTGEWDAGFANAEFATVPCPAWKTGVIAERAGDDQAGSWDVARVPGGAGNWGGSYLAIPQQSEHQEEAYLLARFLTSAEGHLAAFEEVGAMPSSIAGLEDPRFSDTTNSYFNDAPTGRIFAESAQDLEAIHLGANHQHVWENIFEREMQAAEQGGKAPDQAFDDAIAEVHRTFG